MNFIYLQSFYHVVSTNSYSKTANQLGYSQSNISYHIHKLEEQYGRELLFKRKEKIVLTKAGELVFTFAQSLMKEHHKLLNQLEQENEVLRIGTIESLSSSLMITYLSKLRKLYPEMKFRVSVEDEQTLFDLLAKDELDLIFIFDEMTTNTMNYVHLYAEETFELVTHKKNMVDHPASYEMILTDNKCSYRKAFLEQYRSAMNISIALELANPEDIKKLLSSGNETAFLPKYATKDLSSQDFIHSPLPLNRPFYLQWLFADEKKNSQLDKLISLLLEDPHYEVKIKK
ncbi:LysR family transcriptional regulator [Enterococcus wangshanyuanii]|uniref:LysR family transcriptional regulator n=1 Tax=Enterococcus wangshanyuanii TaxID=2005703 RepID=A0ABQ1PUA4_9ENTE|nr:LysR family transcriptional regulator [Enterococcus wangshanyuanii]GGD03893.1 LysR family transcriptional regulator [Enterococcus wangshanyuanii]